MLDGIGNSAVPERVALERATAVSQVVSARRVVEHVQVYAEAARRSFVPKVDNARPCGGPTARREARHRDVVRGERAWRVPSSSRLARRRSDAANAGVACVHDPSPAVAPNRTGVRADLLVLGPLGDCRRWPASSLAASEDGRNTRPALGGTSMVRAFRGLGLPASDGSRRASGTGRDDSGRRLLHRGIDRYLEMDWRRE